MRFSIHYYEAEPTPGLIEAEGTFSFVASATVVVEGGDILVYENDELSPFDLEDGIGSPFLTSDGEGSPFILQPSLL